MFKREKKSPSHSRSKETHLVNGLSDSEMQKKYGYLVPMPSSIVARILTLQQNHGDEKVQMRAHKGNAVGYAA